jgi:hypothetical protein
MLTNRRGFLMLLLSARGAVAAAQAQVDEPGAYEPVVAGYDPAIYLKFGGDFADSSGNGRNGGIGGSGGSFVAALAANVGAGNTAFDTEGTAHVGVAHAAADVALTTIYASPWNGDHSANRFVASVTISAWFSPQSLPAGGDRAVIFAKSVNQTPGVATSYDGSFEAYFDANGAVHLEMRSFRGRPCRIRTPDGAVTTSTTYHLAVQLSYDGVAAWLDGAKFEDGYANLMHVYGLAADIRGTTVANTNDWTIGRAAWGGQADVIVDEFAVYLHRPATDLSQSDIEALAQQESTPPALDHYIWGRLTVNENSYANVQAAIDDVAASGGGTVLINPGNYTGEGDIVLKTGVRIKANGGTVQLNRIRTPTPSYSTLGSGTGDLAEGDRTLNVTNSLSPGDVLRIRTPEGSPAPLYVDRRYNSPSETNDGGVMDSECFEIESATGSAATFVGWGCYFPYTQANRDSVEAFTPNKWLAMEGDIQVAHAFNPVLIRQSINSRIIGCTFENTSTNKDNHPFRIEWNSMRVQVRDCTVINATITGGGGSENTALNVQHGSTDIVYKDCATAEGRHGVDFISSGNFGATYRCEAHQVHHSNINSTSASGASLAIGTHGGTVDCILWNCSSDWGAPGVTGWRHDQRWGVHGDPGRASSSGIGMNDGNGETYIRDIRLLRPGDWFDAGEGGVSVDRCHFENITRSATPTGAVHFNLNYGTGGNANTYRNVAEPAAAWIEV